MAEGVIGINLSYEDGSLFIGLGKVPYATHSHAAPVESSPALRHHQQIQCFPVLVVILLEVPSWVGHKALYLAGQQHFRHDAAVVKRQVCAVGIPYSQ